jgi:hypothetical protein
MSDSASSTGEQLSKSISGIVSGVTSSATDLLDTAVSIPLEAVSAVAEIGETGADRPLTVATVTTVLSATPDLTHSSGLDTSTRIALSQSKVPILIPEIGGTTDDEMSFAKLFSTPSLLTTFDADLGMPVGQLLLSLPVNPKWLPIQNPEDAGSPPAVVYPTILAKASYPFSYWRGSMRYKFYCVASSFHSMRFRICFEPCADGIALAFSEELFTRIVEIAGQTEFTVEVPFIFPQLYASHSIGQLNIYVASSMSNTSTLTTMPMTTLVYVAGGSDLVVKAPAPHFLIPASSLGSSVLHLSDP